MGVDSGNPLAASCDAIRSTFVSGRGEVFAGGPSGRESRLGLGLANSNRPYQVEVMTVSEMRHPLASCLICCGTLLPPRAGS